MEEKKTEPLSELLTRYIAVLKYGILIGQCVELNFPRQGIPGEFKLDQPK